MQFIVTQIITNLVQDEDETIKDYGIMMRLNGVILILAAIPIVALPLLKIKCTNSKHTSKA
mgnify:FL=1